MSLEITEVFYPRNRQEWRDWLIENHQGKSEIWVQRFKKSTGKLCVNYDELVEEVLCFGWVDSTVRKYEQDSTVQRITPRRKKSFLSEMNRQRIWKLEKLDKMYPAGYEVIGDQIGNIRDPFDIPDWVLRELQILPEVWANYQAFPLYYQRLRIGYIKECGTTPSRIAEAHKRLNHFIKMTARNKKYGTRPLEDLPEELLRDFL